MVPSGDPPPPPARDVSDFPSAQVGHPDPSDRSDAAHRVARAMTKLVKTGRGGGRGAGDRGGRGGRGAPHPAGKHSQPEKRRNAGWKDAFNAKFKWKARAGKAVKARANPVHPAMRPLPKGRELTPAEVRKMLHPVLQPVRAKYSGQGLAKQSVYVDIADPEFDAKVRELYDEHVDGFSGKSYKKMGNAQDMMEWRVRLKEKAEREGTAVTKKKRRDADDDAANGSGGSSKSAGGVNWKRAKPRLGLEPTTDASSRAVGLDAEAPAGAGGGLSRKQMKKAAQMGLTRDAMLALQTSKVKIAVDDKVREGAIEAYRAMQRAKMQAAKGTRGR